MIALALLVIIGAVGSGFLAGEARAEGDGTRLSLTQSVLAAASDESGLQMIPIVSPARVAEWPGDRQKERLRQNNLNKTLGVAVVAGAAAIVGGILAGPGYGTAAGAAVVISYLLLP